MMKKYLCSLLLLPMLVHAKSPTIEECVTPIRDALLVKEYQRKCSADANQYERLRANTFALNSMPLLDKLEQCQPTMANASAQDKRTFEKLINWSELEKLPALWDSLSPEQRQARCTKLLDDWEKMATRYQKERK